MAHLLDVVKAATTAEGRRLSVEVFGLVIDSGIPERPTVSIRMHVYRYLLSSIKVDAFLY